MTGWWRFIKSHRSLNIRASRDNRNRRTTCVQCIEKPPQAIDSWLWTTVYRKSIVKVSVTFIDWIHRRIRTDFRLYWPWRMTRTRISDTCTIKAENTMTNDMPCPVEMQPISTAASAVRVTCRPTETLHFYRRLRQLQESEPDLCRSPNRSGNIRSDPIRAFDVNRCSDRRSDSHIRLDLS